MIDMGVRQNDCVDRLWINWELGPVALSERFVPLEQTAIDE
jgi:hypothetical protein